MRRLRAAHTAEKLSPRQFQLLGLLHDRGGITQRDLGTLMAVEPRVLGTLLNPLEAEGYLARERDPTDRRRHVVTLTTGWEAATRSCRPGTTRRRRRALRRPDQEPTRAAPRSPPDPPRAADPRVGLPL